MHATNPRWRIAAILKKKLLDRHISATDRPILMKFGKMMHIVPYKGKTVKISNFWKSKMAAATILKNHKNRDISETVWPIFTKFGTIMQNRSLNCSLKIWISKIQDGGRLPIWKAVISPYLRNRLTDFDEICHDYTNWPSTEDGPLKVWIF